MEPIHPRWAARRQLVFLVLGAFFVMRWLTRSVEAAPFSPFSPLDDASFARVVLQSRWIIVGSITAFLIAQLVDVTVFCLVRHRTGGAEGSW